MTAHSKALYILLLFLVLLVALTEWRISENKCSC